MTDNKDLRVESCPKCNGAAFTRGDGIYCAPAQPAPVAAEQSVPGLCDECESYDCVCDPPPPHTKAFEV